MKTKLKDFQEAAVRDLHKNIHRARREVLEEAAMGGSALQAVILSSPTGSGKTVTLCALLEQILNGSGEFEGDPKARFLWLSDSPQLNEQSKNKLEQHSDVFGASRREIIENTFCAEVLEAGVVYFLNTGKLGEKALLTQPREECAHTIWQTLANTVRKFPGSLYLVIDEAHRGMTQAREINTARTIVQKFILGDPAVGMPAVPLVIGMSATPQRFRDLLGTQARTKREVEIPVQDVVASGLLKELIVMDIPALDTDAPEGIRSDWTLLSAAVEDLARYRREWESYCRGEGEDVVAPVLVVQVEDKKDGASTSAPTQTDLNTLIATIEASCDKAGLPLGKGAIRHCFQDGAGLVAAGHNIEHIDPSRVQEDDVVRIVLFKTALVTGWDCPRAEVMMSFRRAQDVTHITQLVGRMVRTPLARRVEKVEFLNSVRLYLPHYNARSLEDVKKALQNPEHGTVIDVTTRSASVEYERAPASEQAFKLLESLPSYYVARVPRKPDTSRVLSLGRLLTRDKIDAQSWDEANELVLDALWSQWEGLPPAESARLSTMGRLKLRELSVSYGEWNTSGDRERTVELVPASIGQLFENCGRKLGEGLHKEWDTRFASRFDPHNPLLPRMALYLLLSQPSAWEAIGKRCAAQVDEWLSKHRFSIRDLPEARRGAYDSIRGQARRATTRPLKYPSSISGGQGEASWKKHLFCDVGGDFCPSPKLNTWELPVLEKELGRAEVEFWLRNAPNKDWSLCVPVADGVGETACYPDFLVLRRENGHLLVDILDPHDNTLEDAWQKAVALARYAQNHGGSDSPFGRIEIMAEIGGKLKRLDLQDGATRSKVSQITTNDGLRVLYQAAP